MSSRGGAERLGETKRFWGRMRSFRLRIALLSVVLSGVVLIVFAGFTLAAVQRTSLSRIDEDIREFAHRHLIEPQGPERWDRVSEALGYFFGDEEGEGFILLVKDRDNTVAHISSNWPDEIPTDAFAPPDMDYAPADPPPVREGPDDLDAGPPGAMQNGPDGARSPRRPPPGMRGPPPGRGLRGEGFGPPRGRPQPPWAAPAPLKTPEFQTRSAGGTEWRIGVMGNPEVTLVLGLDLKRLNAEIAQVRRALLMVLPAALLFIALGAWWISERALKPINALSATVEQVTAKGLDQRIVVQDEDQEFSRLIAVFNEMMDRLEEGFNQAVRFSADASHELKTPLAILQGQLERGIHEAPPNSDEQRRYSTLAKEVQRLKSIVRKLLLLSRADAGELNLNLRPLNLSVLLEGISEDCETLAPHLRIKSDLTPGLRVMADADLMKQVLQNLASNAIKYSRKGGAVSLKLRARDKSVRFTIANTGKNIPPEDREKVFKRFFRSDRARRRRIRGAGLGLSLAREIVRAHHGELRLQDTQKGITAFSLTLPRTDKETDGQGLRF